MCERNRARAHTHESLIHLCILCDTRSRLLHASTRLSIFFLRIAFIRSSPYARDQPFPLLLYHVLLLTAAKSSPLPPPPSLSNVYTLTSLRLRPYLSAATGNSARLSIAHVLSVVAPFTIPPPSLLPPVLVTTLLSLLIFIDATSRARVCPRRLSSSSSTTPQSALSVRMHRARLCTTRSPVLSAPPRSPLFATLAARYITASVSVSPFPERQSVPPTASRLPRLFRVYAACLRARHSATPVSLRRSFFYRSDISFVPAIPRHLSLHVKPSEFSPGLDLLCVPGVHFHPVSDFVCHAGPTLSVDRFLLLVSDPS